MRYDCVHVYERDGERMCEERERERMCEERERERERMCVCVYVREKGRENVSVCEVREGERENSFV